MRLWNDGHGEADQSIRITYTVMSFPSSSHLGMMYAASELNMSCVMKSLGT